MTDYKSIHLKYTPSVFKQLTEMKLALALKKKINLGWDEFFMIICKVK